MSAITRVHAEALWVMEGHFVPGGFALGLTLPESQVWLDDEIIFVDQKGWFVLGFAWDSPQERILRIKSPETAEYAILVRLQERKYKETAVDGVPQRTIKPNQQQRQRIKKEQILMENLRKKPVVLDSSHPLLQVWQAPLGGRISGGFGDLRHFNHQVLSRHFGQDIAASFGSPILAPSNGTVILVQDLFLSGKTIVIDHGFGLLSSYLHLSESKVTVGETVLAGQTIAAVGKSGRATGAHLDWRVSWKETRLDPSLFLQPMQTMSNFISLGKNAR